MLTSRHDARVCCCCAPTAAAHLVMLDTITNYERSIVAKAVDCIALARRPDEQLAAAVHPALRFKLWRPTSPAEHSLGGS